MISSGTCLDAGKPRRTIDDGRIRETGTHLKLPTRRGNYDELIRNQVRTAYLGQPG